MSENHCEASFSPLRYFIFDLLSSIISSYLSYFRQNKDTKRTVNFVNKKPSRMTHDSLRHLRHNCTKKKHI